MGYFSELDIIIQEHDDSIDTNDAMYDAVYDGDDTVTQLNRAGMDDLTPVDTFMQANGDYIFVTNPQEETY